MIEQAKQLLGVTPQDLTKPVILKQKGEVFYMLLNTKANTFTKEFVRAIHAALDQVEANDGPTALVTISLSKLFSGGIDLRVMSHLQPEDGRSFAMQFVALLGRVATFPMPTFCLVRGGAVAGGCMFAFAHDFVFVGGKALFSTNQSQNQLHFPPGMMAVVRKRHAYPHVLRDMVILSKQYSAEEAAAEKLIDGVWKEEQALKEIQRLAGDAAQFGDNKVNMSKIKGELYKDVIEGCFQRRIEPYNFVGYHRMHNMPKL